MGAVAREDPAAGGLFMEVLLAGLAIHAYRIARTNEKRILATIDPAPQFDRIGGLPPAIPLALAVVFAAAYLGLCCIGFFLPDYSAINQTPAHISRKEHQVLYSNPEYGIEFSAPLGWTVADQGTKEVVSARRDDNVCGVSLRLGAWSPILPLGSYLHALSEQLQQPENRGSHFLRVAPAMLGGLSGRDIVLTIDQHGNPITEHQIIARKGMTLYILTLDSLPETATQCQSDFRFIKENFKLQQ